MQLEFYQPLVPVSKNFKTCFRIDSSGNQVIDICANPASAPALEENRSPAQAPAPDRTPAPRPRGKLPR